MIPPPPATPALAVYPVVGVVPRRYLATGSGDLGSLVLEPDPVFTAADIVAYNFDDHRDHWLRLRPDVEVRIPRVPPVTGAPFVLTVRGDRVYLGIFLGAVSSHAFGVPVFRVEAVIAHSGIYSIDRSGRPEKWTEPDVRDDPRIREVLGELGLIHPGYSDAWSELLAWRLPGLRVTDSGVRGVVADWPGCAEPIRRWADGRFCVKVTPALAPGRCVAVVEVSEADEAGRFEIALAPGDYFIAAHFNWRARGAPPYFPAVQVTVRPGQWEYITLAEV